MRRHRFKHRRFDPEARLTVNLRTGRVQMHEVIGANATSLARAALVAQELERVPLLAPWVRATAKRGRARRARVK